MDIIYGLLYKRNSEVIIEGLRSTDNVQLGTYINNCSMPKSRVRKQSKKKLWDTRERKRQCKK